MKINLQLAVLTAFGLAFFITAPVMAQDEPGVTDDEVNEIASQLYCPICENVPLDVCPSQACSDWREVIREYLSQGWTEDQIKEYFAAQYGWNVLPVPPRTGLNWLIYVGPPIIFIGGGLFAVLLVMKGKQKATPAPEITPLPDDLLESIKKDLEGEEPNE